ncbi:MAG: FAD-dependent oxidoreductase, partial [Dehalococcoidia bacterium]|nr:FAD-dependent oxidoreductase [Dehalococcoidia bacterium]
MTIQIKKLFEPITVGNIEIRNRTRISAMAMGYAENMFVTDRLVDFYADRAKGGAGIIGIASTASPLWELVPFVGVWHDKFIPGLKKLSDAMHAHGAKTYVQVGVGYGWVFTPYGEVELPTPSGVAPVPEGARNLPFRLGTRGRQNVQYKATTVAEIKQIVEGYGDAARRIREAGFDGFEIMLGAGYYLCHWLSPLTNKRTDQYGGSLENRMRMSVEIIDNIKKKAGSDFTIMVKLGTSDLVIGGGYHLEDAKQMAAILEKAGAAGFDLVPGWHESGHVAMNRYVPDGSWVYLAEEIKKAVKVPVASGMRFADPILAEKALREGRCDQINWARPFIADPEYVNKIKEGRLDDIRTCIVCNKCVETVDSIVICSVNGFVSHENEWHITPAKKAKNVVVVGGGPAGMEAARVAAIRGHKVTLIEKEKELGGALIPGGVPPSKSKENGFRDYLVAQVKKNANITLKLGEKATVASVLALKPDAVVVANGAAPIIPEIPGLSSEHVVHALDVLNGKAKVGHEVVIIGGGMVGLETAEYLVSLGKKITILELLPRAGVDVGRLTRWSLMDGLARAGVKIETKMDTKEITFRGVRAN